ncbi:MAG: hypothetical protein DRP06_04500 [Candidatus Aenigmatarchaeota archaeon]|nr:MAG: hypothetical protein DRP06_04500 [Candidatus Aenigmarchaeota archaeon]
MGTIRTMFLIFLAGLMTLIMEEILMIWFVMFFTPSILAIMGGCSLIYIKMKSKKGVYYRHTSIVDKYHFISY